MQFFNYITTIFILLFVMINTNAQTKLSGRVYDYAPEMDLKTAKLITDGNDSNGIFLFLNDSVLIKIDYRNDTLYTKAAYHIRKGVYEQLSNGNRRWAAEVIDIEMDKNTVKETTGNNIEKVTADTVLHISMQYSTTLNDRPYYFSEEGYGNYLYMVPSRRKLNAVLKELKAKGILNLLGVK